MPNCRPTPLVIDSASFATTQERFDGLGHTATVRACPSGAMTDRLPRFPLKQKDGTSALGHTVTVRACPGGALTDRLPRFPLNQKGGTSPLGHTAPRRFTGGSESLGSENASAIDPKCGASPLGHTATGTRCQPNSLRRVPSHLKPAKDCWSTLRSWRRLSSYNSVALDRPNPARSSSSLSNSRSNGTRPLGPFAKRGAALAAEVRWLERHWLPTNCTPTERGTEHGSDV